MKIIDLVLSISVIQVDVRIVPANGIQRTANVLIVFTGADQSGVSKCCIQTYFKIAERIVNINAAGVALQAGGNDNALLVKKGSGQVEMGFIISTRCIYLVRWCNAFAKKNILYMII